MGQRVCSYELREIEHSPHQWGVSEEAQLRLSERHSKLEQTKHKYAHVVVKYFIKLTMLAMRNGCINPGGCTRPTGPAPSETDDLDVQISFDFVNPLNGKETITMTGNAIPGEVADAGSDYTLKFAPKEFAFGKGGKFSLDLNDLNISNMTPVTLTASITLLSAPAAANPGGGEVPEPATLALMGLGLAGLSVRAKRRKA